MEFTLTGFLHIKGKVWSAVVKEEWPAEGNWHKQIVENPLVLTIWVLLSRPGESEHAILTDLSCSILSVTEHPKEKAPEQ